MVDKYLNLITSQHRGKPKFTSWLTAALLKIDDTASFLLGLSNDFDIDQAIGNQLDILGEIVGLKRTILLNSEYTLLDDDSYRFAIKAKVLKNRWDGTTQGIYDVWHGIFPEYGLRVTDNQDMSVTYLAAGSFTPTIKNLIQGNYVIPKSCGVSAQYTFGYYTNGVTDGFGHDTGGLNVEIAPGKGWANKYRVEWDIPYRVSLDPPSIVGATKYYLISIGFSTATRNAYMSVIDGDAPITPASSETPLWEVSVQLLPENNYFINYNDLRAAATLIME